VVGDVRGVGAELVEVVGAPDSAPPRLRPLGKLRGGGLRTKPSTRGGKSDTRGWQQVKLEALQRCGAAEQGNGGSFSCNLAVRRV
jgi:hypothetical protein